MSESPDPPKDTQNASRIAAEADTADISLLSDFISFLKHNKKWWLIPLLLSLAIIGLLAAAGGSALGPFIYPMI